MAARARILDLNELLDRYGDRRPRPGPPPTGRAGTTRSRTAARPNAARRGGGQLPPARRRASAAALRRLAAFGNRWSVELAEEMLAGADQVVVDPVPMLDRLVELGLVQVRGPGPFRFRAARRGTGLRHRAGRGGR